MTTSPPTTDAVVKRILRRELAAFFKRLMSTEPGWPGATDSQLVDALAHALIDAGKQTGQGPAMLQTLVFDLQDTINRQLKD